MPEPNFIHIGPGRTGTTYIFKMLDQHPEIELPKQKEINYFHDKYDKGYAWYASLFPNYPHTITGDFSNLYFYNKTAVERIARDLPRVKVFCVLRNPYDRAISNFRYQQRSGNMNATLSFSEALKKHPDLGEQYHFSELLGHHLSMLNGRLYVGMFDELQDYPREFFRKLFRYLGVEESFIPQDLEEKVNQAASLKYPATGRLFRKLADALRKIGLTYLLDGLKNSSILQKVIYSKPDQKSIQFPKEIRIKMNRDIDKLAELTGKNLSHWKR